MKIYPNNYPEFITHQNKAIPEKLFYAVRNIQMTDMVHGQTFTVDVFNMADTKSGECLGNMIGRTVKNCSLNEIYPKKNICDTYEIMDLHVRYPFFGYGTDFINLAKTESNANGCNGRVFLLASKMYNPKNPCHIFYRKKGFTTVSEKVNQELDKCIAEHKTPDPDSNAVKNMFMYLPIEEKQPQHFLSRLSNFMKKLIKHSI